MTWTSAEAEVILREKWDDAGEVGGFSNDWQRELALKELREEFGDAIDSYELLGLTSFSDYEEGETTTLWQKPEDNSLWMLRAGVSIYGAYGEDFSEIESVSMRGWLNHVEANQQWAKTFQGS